MIASPVFRSWPTEMKRRTSMWLRGSSAMDAVYVGVANPSPATLFLEGKSRPESFRFRAVFCLGASVGGVSVGLPLLGFPVVARCRKRAVSVLIFQLALLSLAGWTEFSTSKIPEITLSFPANSSSGPPECRLLNGGS